MRFEMDNTLLDDILFSMENQDGEYLLDTQQNQIIDINFDDIEEEPDFNEIDFDKTDRYISLPQWSSADGYRLMEKFSSELKNPIIRQELSAALNRNKGVFRAFKDVLEQYPETVKHWYIFKEQKMKEEVIDWYNSLREEWGLKPIGNEPEDTTSLILEDFIFKNGDDEFSIITETATGEPAGTISANMIDSVLFINSLEIKNEYRGMGLGKTLLAKMLAKADEQKLDVSIDLPAESEFFSRSLLLEEFKPIMQRFIRNKK